MVLHFVVIMVLSSGLMSCQSLKVPRSALRRIMEKEGTWDSRFMADSPTEAARNFIDLTAMEVARPTSRYCDAKCETAVIAMRQELEKLIENMDSEDRSSGDPQTTQSPEPKEETASDNTDTTSSTTTPKPSKKPKRNGNRKKNNGKGNKSGNGPGSNKGGKANRAAVKDIVKTSIGGGLTARIGEKARVARHGTLHEDDLRFASGSGAGESFDESGSDEESSNDTDIDYNGTSESSGHNKLSDTNIAPDMVRLGSLSVKTASDKPDTANHDDIDNDSDKKSSLLTIQSIAGDATSLISSSSRTNSDSDNTNSDNPGLLDTLLDVTTSIKTTPFSNRNRGSNRIENDSSVNSQGSLTGSTNKCSSPDCDKGRSGAANITAGATKIAGPSQRRSKRQAGGEVEGQVYILYCRAEGDFMKYGNHRSLCGSCMAIKSLPRNRYFPKFFNQVHCGGGDSTCLKFEKNTGHGQCLERNLHFKIFENLGTTRYPNWWPTTVRVPTCCECVMNSNSKYTQLFQ